jgi:hypothetical protein
MGIPARRWKSSEQFAAGNVIRIEHDGLLGRRAGGVRPPGGKFRLGNEAIQIGTRRAAATPDYRKTIARRSRQPHCEIGLSFEHNRIEWFFASGMSVEKLVEGR